jgi:signal transduction histidine kinase
VSLIAAPVAADRVTRAVDALDETIHEIRSSIYALQARPDLAVPGLRARVLAVADEMTPLLGFAPTLQLTGRLDDEVPDDVAEHVLTVLREALSNVARHANARQVEVQVRAAGDLTLVIADDGRGLSDTTRRSGLANMEDRAAQVGGSMEVESAPDKGTTLTWRAPLPQAGSG